ncbi:MAG TPA: type IX secretion system sortase PorU [Flavobacteriales bacterium]
MRPIQGPITLLAILLLSPVVAQEQRRSTTDQRAATSTGRDQQVAGAVRPMTWAEGMVRDAERQGLPYIHIDKALAPNTVGVTVRLVDERYEPLTAEQVAQLPGLGTPGAAPELHSMLGIQRKKPWAMVDLYPYRRNSATGQLERLVDYTVVYDEEKGTRGGQAKANTYPGHSKLATGDWFRFTVPDDGVYKLTSAFLQQLGVDLNGLASDQINIYGNHAAQLPYTNTPFKPTDLLLNAIQVEDGGDGQFDAGDHILFYATGAQGWRRGPQGRFQHLKNVYSDVGSYFIGIGVDPPKRVIETVLSQQPATDQVTAFNDMQVIDRDVFNLLKSGRTFFSEVYDLVTTYNYAFQVPHIRSSEPVVLVANVFGRTLNDNTSSFSVSAGSHSENIPMPGVSGNYEGPYGVMVNRVMSFTHGSPTLPITVTFNKYDPLTSLGWMDYLELNARRDLRMVGDQMKFRDTVSVGIGRIAEFTLEQASGVYRVWEVSDPLNVANVPLTNAGTARSFRLATDSLRTFIAFRNSGFPEPTAVGRVQNQDLHATSIPMDLVIVCPPEFQSAAAQLAQRRAAEGLTVTIVSPQQVFNEFSSGQRDASAIKRYMKMLYDHAGTDESLMPRYLLLFGDGSFNNINTSASNQNWIPSYQTANGWLPNQTYTSDDFFALLDDNEGEAGTDLVDIGVGRLPVSDATQADAVLKKILDYDKLSLLGATNTSCATGSEGGANDWRNWVLFVSDDQDGSDSGFEFFHTTYSEALADNVTAGQPFLNISKIYMDAYPQTSTPGGQRYLEGSLALKERVQKGALVVNYIGHGGEVGWGHERFLDNSTILGWTNADRLPLFMTATCEFSRWDDPGRTSAGEYVLLNPEGGGIGLMTTTRIAYSGSNQTISLRFYEHVFSRNDELGRDQRLGDTFRRTKVGATPASGNSVNHRNFSLLGDPSMRLALPEQEVFITAITDTLGAPVDTIRALSVIRVQGHVGTASTPDADFNGVAIPTIFDKQLVLYTLANDVPASPLPFKLRKNMIHRGKVSVVNGQFTCTFMVPRDINYAYGPGRISVYAESASSNATGFTQDPIIGGTDPDAGTDEQGPVVELYLNDERFVAGGITNETPLIFAKLFDTNGINTTGSSIGHDLTAVIDANTSNAIVLNDVYEADQDSYQSGQVRYRLSSLTEGSHTLTLKAWDVFNNSTEKTTDFVVAPSEELALEHVLNYPNPFTTRTEFHFEHNRPCTTLECQVQVFTVGGRLVKTLNRRLNCEGFRSEPLAWDGLDDFGDKLARGVYVYRLSIATADGAKADKFEKLVILR